MVPAPLLDGPENDGAAASSTRTTVISLPWSVPAFPSVKGVLHQPEAAPTLKRETRDAILLAIAKARSWIDDLVSGRVQSFDEIGTAILLAKSRGKRPAAAVDDYLGAHNRLVFLARSE